MILLFSEDGDLSTTKVMEYLKHWEKKVIRINNKDAFDAKVNIKISRNNHVEIGIITEWGPICFSDVKSIWFRRGAFYFSKMDERHVKGGDQMLRRQVNNHLVDEQNTLTSFMYRILLSSGIKILGNPLMYNVKKLDVLRKASFFGLEIPETLITTNKCDVLEFLQRKGSLITKAIQDNISVEIGESIYGTFTEEINELNCKNIPDIFYPSLFQEKLEKRYEIRCFYLDGLFFNIAIYSQQMNETKIDLRNLTTKVGNRISGIDIPEEVKMKLKELLYSLGLNTGSVDLVYTSDRRYIFLEVNPAGQYDFVGKLLNYQIDKKIAEWLSA